MPRRQFPRVILPNLFHQQLNLPERNTNHSNKDITWSTPGHDWQNGWKTIYVVSTCRDWRFYQSCSFLIWWLICFFRVILFYQCDWLPFWVWVGIISFWHFEPLVFFFCGIFNVWQTGLGKTYRNRPSADLCQEKKERHCRHFDFRHSVV